MHPVASLPVYKIDFIEKRPRPWSSRGRSEYFGTEISRWSVNILSLLRITSYFPPMRCRYKSRFSKSIKIFMYVEYLKNSRYRKYRRNIGKFSLHVTSVRKIISRSKSGIFTNPWYSIFQQLNFILKFYENWIKI